MPWSDWWRVQHPAANGAPLAVGAVVIGSGYGGSVAALRLAEQGHQVLLLERGSEYLPGEFPNDASALPKAFRAPSLDGRNVLGRANGLFEGRAGPGLVAVLASGLGGGSLINAGVVLAPEDEVFAQPAWPDAIRKATDGQPHGLTRWLQMAQGELGVHPSTLTFPKTAALQRLNAALPGAGLQQSVRWQRVPLTIDPAHCTGCGDCASGCNVPGAKRKLRDTYLAKAVATGRVTVLSSATVYTLRPSTHHGAPWRLRVLATPRITGQVDWASLDQREGIELQADLVVVAAGTFGSTELLQRSQARAGAAFWLSPALGTRLSGNGDGLAASAGERLPVGAVGWGADTWQTAADADAPADAASAAQRVGPTITAMLDLRGSDPDASRQKVATVVALERRIVMQDAAVPGALGRLTAELLASVWTLQQLGRCGLAPTQGHRFDADPLAAGDLQGAQAAQTLAQHSQVLLSMGHDGSHGRIVWQDGRDASVPFWTEVQELATYQVQNDWLQHVRELGGLPLVNPVQQMPPGLSTQLDPAAVVPRAIMTVHPLGGCPMADEPARGVVDDRGRVYADLYDHRRRWQGLYVLDGAVVPTSLGINPLLTITAIAERAAAQFPQPAPTRSALVTLIPARLAPQPLRRAQRMVQQADLSERLAARLQLRGALARALALPQGQYLGQGLDKADADLGLSLTAPDWLALWDDPRHRLTQFRGALRLRFGDRLLAYTVNDAGSHADLLAVGAAPSLQLPGRGWRDAIEWLGELGPLRFARTLFTAAVLRGPDAWLGLRLGNGQRSDSAALVRWTRALSDMVRVTSAALRQLRHASASRHMHYALQLTLDRSACRGLAPDEAAPERLTLLGRKQVAYGATLEEIARWLPAWWRRSPVTSAGERRALPRLRESFFEQATHLQVHLRDADGTSLGQGRLRMDIQSLLAAAPLRLGPRGDTTNGVIGLGAYLGVFARTLATTRLLDFRAPTVSGAPLPDNSDERLMRLRLPGGIHVAAERIVLKVARGESASAAAGEDASAPVELVLWRYRRPDAETQRPKVTAGRWCGQPVRRARSLLLLHAFGQSAYTFTAQSLGADAMAPALYQAGWEVWLLDHRISTRLPEGQRPSTMDQIARHDLPGAVQHILAQLDAELGAKAGDPPLQIFAFAQCIGAASLAMSLLSGRLSHGLPAWPAAGLAGAGAGAPAAVAAAAIPTGAAPPPAAVANPPVLRQPGDTQAADDHPEFLDPHAGDPTARLSMLAGAMFSQTHLHCIGTPLTQSKTWVPSLIRDAFGRAMVPFAVRGPVTSALEGLLDRAFAALPVPDAEACPPRRAGEPEDDCATCRRIRFIEAPLFKHANLSDATHRELPLLFGDANVRLFAHAAMCVNAERLVNENGRYVYVHDEAIARHLALPLGFVHGTENELFDVESATRTARQVARVHPDFAAQMRAALGHAAGPVHDGATLLIADHGHLDVLIGRQAAELLHRPLARAFDALLAHPDHGVQPDAARPAPRWVSARLPQTGPLIGMLAATQHGGSNLLQLRVSFRIDDRFSDAKRNPGRRGNGRPAPAPQPGTRTWAFARVRLRGALVTTQPLDITTVPAPGIDLYRKQPLHTAADGERFAHGTLILNAGQVQAAPQPASLTAATATGVPAPALEIECFSVHDAIWRLLPPPQQPDLRVIDPALDHATGLPLPNWFDALLAGRQAFLQGLEKDQWPGADTVSYLRRKPERFEWRLATLSEAALQAALAPLATLPAPNAAPPVPTIGVPAAVPTIAAPRPPSVAIAQPAGTRPIEYLGARFASSALERALRASTGNVRNGPARTQARRDESAHLMIGNCRYPGFALEAGRVDNWLRLLNQATTGVDAPPAWPEAQFGLLVGDQIYADATAGFVDELSPTERYNHRHGQAFGRWRTSRTGNRQPERLGDWLATLPVVMVPDDHEFIDGHPNAAPLLQRPPSLGRPPIGPNDPVQRTAWWAVRAFQRLQSAPYTAPATGWQIGPLRALALDTRSDRARVPPNAPVPGGTILNRQLRRAILNWMASPEALDRLNLLACGSVVAPQLHFDADPTSPSGRDDLAFSPRDRQWLLHALHQRAASEPRFRFLLVSGDYHVSALATLDDEAGRRVGAALLAPPMYAPMPYLDAPAHGIDVDERVALPGGAAWQVRPANATTHPAHPAGALAVQRGSGCGVVSVARLAPPDATTNAATALYRITLRRRLIAWVDGTGPQSFEHSVDV